MNKIDPDSIGIDELLTRGVEKIYPSREELEKVLRSGKKLKLYQGFDPTGIDLHIGHMVGLRKLAQFQKLGHHVIFLIGDATAMVGDPTGKDKSRNPLTREQVLDNAKTYKEQAGKILDFDGENPVEIMHNSTWLNKMNGVEFMNLASLISYNQIIERDIFQKRLENQQSIGVLELIYPMLQGYDSVVMEVDLEIGGSDQMFNMMIGRDLLKKIKNKDKSVMTTPLLTDAAGNKIGKTEGNVIALTDKPEDLYGKIMSLSDDIIVKGLKYLTDVSMDEIKTVEHEIKKGSTPIDYKKLLAFEIVKQLSNEEDAKGAQEHFERVVQHKELPIEIPSITLPNNFPSGLTLAEALVELNLADSKSNAKRLIEQGGVGINNEVIIDPLSAFIPEDGMVIRIGKRNWVRIKV